MIRLGTRRVNNREVAASLSGDFFLFSSSQLPFNFLFVIIALS